MLSSTRKLWLFRFRNHSSTESYSSELSGPSLGFSLSAGLPGGAALVAALERRKAPSTI